MLAGLPPRNMRRDERKVTPRPVGVAQDRRLLLGLVLIRRFAGASPASKLSISVLRPVAGEIFTATTVRTTT
jgi:hypothetical protein